MVDPKEQLLPTQADREAYLTWSGMPACDAESVRRGEWDDTAAMQILTRHRLAGIEEGKRLAGGGVLTSAMIDAGYEQVRRLAGPPSHHDCKRIIEAALSALPTPPAPVQGGETAAIVAWLREETGHKFKKCSRRAMRYAANAIELGKHLTTPPANPGEEA